MGVGVIVVAFGGLVGLSWFITRPVPVEEGAPEPRPIRDASLGKDHYVGERQDRLRKLQADGHRHEQARTWFRRGF